MTASSLRLLNVQSSEPACLCFMFTLLIELIISVYLPLFLKIYSSYIHVFGLLASFFPNMGAGNNFIN